MTGAEPSARRSPRAVDASRRLSDDARAAADELWEAQFTHPFIRGLADGSLAPATFAFFIRQDYLFLIEYGRTLALAAARAPTPELVGGFTRLADETLRGELDLHLGYAERWGITRAQLESERPAPATRAYTDFLLRTAALGEFAEIVGALLPCMWGYSELGQRLARRPRPAQPLYAEWIDTYAAPEFAALAQWCRDVFDETAAQAGEAGRTAMGEAFRVCSEHELAFWESAWRAGGAG